jgi:6-phosphogluconolactonase
MPRSAAVVLFASILLALIFSLGCGTSSHPTVCLGLPSTSSSSGTCTCSGGACPADIQSFVFAAGNNGQIAAFPIVSNTGALNAPVTTSGPTASLGLATMDSAYLYASNPGTGTGGAIDAWVIDQVTGTLTAVSGSPFSLGSGASPSGLVTADNLSSPGPFLYAADSGTIDALQQINNGTGALTIVPGSPFTSGTNQYLATDYLNRFLFAADEDAPGGVLAFTINSSTGALTAVAGSPFALSSSGNVQPGQIVVDPTGSFVYVAMTSTNQVAAFSIVSPSGSLTPVPGSPFAAGNGPNAIAAFNTGDNAYFLYVSNATAGTISGYSINPTTGVLTPAAGSPFAIAATNIVTDLGEGHLYAYGADGLTVFSIDPTTGALLQVGSPLAFPGGTALVYDF